MDLEKIGDRIKHCRKSKKITQVELGNIINKSESTIRKYENGSVTPTFKVLETIALALNVKLDELVPEFKSQKQINHAYYNLLSNTELAELLKDLNPNIERFKSMSIDERENFIVDLSKINPMALKLDSYLKHFDNFSKKDLVDFYHSFLDYCRSSIDTFVKTEYKPQLEESFNIINDLKEIIDDYMHILADRNQLIEEQQKIIELKDAQLNNINKILDNSKI